MVLAQPVLDDALGALKPRLLDLLALYTGEVEGTRPGGVILAIWTMSATSVPLRSRQMNMGRMEPQRRRRRLRRRFGNTLV